MFASPKPSHTSSGRGVKGNPEGGLRGDCDYAIRSVGYGVKCWYSRVDRFMSCKVCLWLGVGDSVVLGLGGGDWQRGWRLNRGGGG